MSNQNRSFLKYILLLISVTHLTLQANAQEIKIDQVSLAYFAPLAVDPGAKVGFGFSFREWTKTKESKEGHPKVWNHKLYVQPQLAYFSKWRFYSSYFVNVETGWQFRKESNRFYSGLGAGLGYIHRREVLTLRTFFDGSTKVLETEGRNFIFPSVNYQLGMKLYRRLDLFSKLHYGYKFSSEHTSESALILEMGLNINLNDKSGTDE